MFDVPPIIIMGAHRSGTSLLARMLEDVGLFLGTRKDANHEARFFLDMNELLLKQSGGRWDYPEPALHAADNRELRALMVDYLSFMVRSPRFCSYLGVNRYLKRMLGWGSGFYWGWKDPRNVYTAPFWLDVFPKARIIHVKRHGVDVAHSLVKRERKRFEAGERRYRSLRERFGWIYWMRTKRHGFGGSVRALNVETAFEFWQEQVSVAWDFLSDSGVPSVTVRFENLVDAPASVLSELVDFIGLSPSDRAVSRASDRVDPSRAFAFEEDPSLVEFAREHRSALDRFDYPATKP